MPDKLTTKEKYKFKQPTSFAKVPHLPLSLLVLCIVALLVVL